MAALEALRERSGQTLSRSVSITVSCASIHLPRLEVLDVKRLTYPYEFPRWIVPENSCTLINSDDGLLSNLPPVSKLWINGLVSDFLLADLCPTLGELRVYNVDLSDEWGMRNESFISMLRRRKTYVNQGREIEGVKMIHLKRLVFPFRLLDTLQLSQLRELVEEVVDLESVERLIEVEI